MFAELTEPRSRSRLKQASRKSAFGVTVGAAVGISVLGVTVGVQVGFTMGFRVVGVMLLRS